jgi:Tfp pilus assembly protein PilN
VSRAVNLASRPHRNEALPSLLLQLACLVVLAITVKHALVVRTLLPSRISATNHEVASLEADLVRLRNEASGFNQPAPEPKAIAQWALLKDLVDKRTFSWTDLLARLEEVTPRGARLVTIQPSTEAGQMILDITAIARSSKDGLDFIKALEEDPAFEDVYPLSKQNSGSELQFRYTMHYLPEALNVPRPAPTADASGGTGESDDKSDAAGPKNDDF